MLLQLKLSALRSIYPIDTFVDDAAGRMEVVGEPKNLPVMEEVQAEVTAAKGPKQMISIERYVSHERAKVYAVIQT